MPCGAPGAGGGSLEGRPGPCLGNDLGREAQEPTPHPEGADCPAVRFRTTVELGGTTATGLPVPAEIVEALGSGKKPAVRVTIGAHTYRSTVATRGGVYLVPLSGENRTAAGGGGR